MALLGGLEKTDMQYAEGGAAPPEIGMVRPPEVPHPPTRLLRTAVQDPAMYSRLMLQQGMRRGRG